MSSWPSAAAFPPPGRRLNDARRRYRAAARAVLVCAVAILASGCIRFRADLAIASDETVSGTIVVAVQNLVSTGLPSLGEVPAPLRDHVRSEVYNQDGYVGSKLTLQRLPFDQFDDLFRRAGATAAANLPNLTDIPGLPGAATPSAAPSSGGSSASTTTELSLHRDGNKVVVAGSFSFPTPAFGADLSAADIRLAMTFPGDVTSANGVRDGRTVTWTFALGQVQPVQAVAYLHGSPAGGPPLLGYVGGGLALALGAAVAVVLVRRRPVPAPATAGGPAPVAVPAAATSHADGTSASAAAGPMSLPLHRDRPAAEAGGRRPPARPVHPLHQEPAPVDRAEPVTIVAALPVGASGPPGRAVHPLHHDGATAPVAEAGGRRPSGLPPEQRLGQPDGRERPAGTAHRERSGAAESVTTAPGAPGAAGSGAGGLATAPRYPAGPGLDVVDFGPEPEIRAEPGRAGGRAGPAFAPWLEPVASLAHRVAADRARSRRRRGGRHRQQEAPAGEAPAGMPSPAPAHDAADPGFAGGPADPGALGGWMPPDQPAPAPPYPYPITGRPPSPLAPVPPPWAQAGAGHPGARPGRDETRERAGTGAPGTPVPPGPGLSPPQAAPWAPPDPR